MQNVNLDFDRLCKSEIADCVILHDCEGGLYSLGAVCNTEDCVSVGSGELHRVRSCKIRPNIISLFFLYIRMYSAALS